MSVAMSCYNLQLQPAAGASALSLINKNYVQRTVAEVGPTLCHKANCTATNTSTTNETQIQQQNQHGTAKIIVGVSVCPTVL